MRGRRSPQANHGNQEAGFAALPGGLGRAQEPIRGSETPGRPGLVGWPVLGLVASPARTLDGRADGVQSIPAKMLERQQRFSNVGHRLNRARAAACVCDSCHCTIDIDIAGL
jgi:hypothetical protein